MKLEEIIRETIKEVEYSKYIQLSQVEKDAIFDNIIVDIVQKIMNKTMEEKNMQELLKVDAIKLIIINKFKLNLSIYDFGYKKMRDREVTDARKICWYILQKRLNFRDGKISNYFHHNRSTIYLGICKLFDLVSNDKKLSTLLENIDEKVVKYLSENVDKQD